mgnify:CR=1 FL=1|tara:strand:- start:7066 stop:7293 length:228 start_codon:yes stop_codon:yes gene_type:complete
MNESQIVETWTLFKEYIDKKNVEVAAERFIDLLADYGVDDKTFKDAMGSDDSLDEAIGYYLDISPEADEFDDWED